MIMPIRVAINGYGRIGRNILRSLYESKRQKEIQIVAINDLAPPEIMGHLTQYDTVHGKFFETIKVENNILSIGQDEISICSERDPASLPWKKYQIDVVLECTGMFASPDKSSAHLKAGAKKVLISAPAGDSIKTIVYGVNHHTLSAGDTMVSNASCTTNCLAPLVKVIHEKIGLVNGLMTTIHSYTNDQVLTDVAHQDIRRARSATHSMIPTKTGAAAAIGLVIPELKGRLDGFAMRVPTINVSIVDLTFEAKEKTSVEAVNACLKFAAEHDLKGILEYSERPLVSIDFNHNPASSIFDSTQTKVIDKTVKVLSWYDNEWGFSNRMLDTTALMMSAK